MDHPAHIKTEGPKCDGTPRHAAAQPIWGPRPALPFCDPGQETTPAMDKLWRELLRPASPVAGSLGETWRETRGKDWVDFRWVRRPLRAGCQLGKELSAEMLSWLVVCMELCDGNPTWRRRPAGKIAPENHVMLGESGNLRSFADIDVEQVQRRGLSSPRTYVHKQAAKTVGTSATPVTLRAGGGGGGWSSRFESTGLRDNGQW
ncbi:hypothetical protein DFJ77DRAFT_544035 [Powellomyces hirtus]|nr:hypothetical protein DFJ77DRAFT_544035 [Powellomyces hirtus]